MKKLSFFILSFLLPMSISLVFAGSLSDSQVPDESLVETTIMQNMEVLGHLGGAPGAVAVQDSYAYVGTGNELAVFDISNPSTPNRIGYVLLPGDITELQVSENYVYAIYRNFTFPNWPYAWVNGLWVVDISNPTAPIGIGEYAISEQSGPYRYGSLRGLSVEGNNLYLLANKSTDTLMPDGLLIVDISTPTIPTEISYSPIGMLENAYLAVENSYAYISSNTYLQVIDVSNPVVPAFRGDLEFSDAYYITAMGAAENFVYLTAGDTTQINDTLFVIDISNPDQPLETAVYPNLVNEVRKLAVSNGYAYLLVFNYSTYLYYFVVIDVSDPASPVGVGSYEIPVATEQMNLTVVGGYAYLTGQYTNLFQILSLSDPANPVETGSYPMLNYVSYSPATLIVASGSYVYVAGYTNIYPAHLACRLWTVDVSHPHMPTLLNELDLLGCNLVDLENVGNYLYLGAADRGLRVIDVSNPASPTEVGVVGIPAGNIEVVGKIVYVLGDTRLHLLDNADPGNPILLGTTEPLPIGNGYYDLSMAVVDHYAYIALYNQIVIVDVATPASPSQAGSYVPSSGSFYGEVVASSNYLYVMKHDDPNLSFLQMIDITNRTELTELGSLPTNYQTFYNLARSNNYIYLTTDYGGLSVIDVTDPFQPVEVAYYKLPGYAIYPNSNAVVGEDNIYYIDSYGLSLLELSPTAIGSVQNVNGLPVASVTLSVGEGLTGTTDSNGRYTIPDLVIGNNYTITPSLPGFVFLPPNHTGHAPSLNEYHFTLIPEPIVVTLSPILITTLTYTDSQNLPTSLLFPAGIVTTTATASVTPAIAIGTEFATTGHAFELVVEEENGRSTPFTLPVPLTIHYSETDMRVVTDENALKLYHWDGATWVDSALSCNAPFELDVENNVVETGVCGNGRYALLGPTHQIFLPITMLTCNELFGCRE